MMATRMGPWGGPSAASIRAMLMENHAYYLLEKRTPSSQKAQRLFVLGRRRDPEGPATAMRSRWTGAAGIFPVVVTAAWTSVSAKISLRIFLGSGVRLVPAFVVGYTILA